MCFFFALEIFKCKYTVQCRSWRDLWWKIVVIRIIFFNVVERINTDPALTMLRKGGHTFSYEWKDTECLDEPGLNYLVEMWAQKSGPVDAYIGQLEYILIEIMNNPINIKIHTKI